MEIAPYKIPACLMFIHDTMKILKKNQQAISHEKKCLLSEKEQFASVFDVEWLRLETEQMGADKAMFHLQEAKKAVEQIARAN